MKKIKSILFYGVIIALELAVLIMEVIMLVHGHMAYL